MTPQLMEEKTHFEKAEQLRKFLEDASLQDKDIEDTLKEASKLVVTANLLKETRIGVLVNKLKTSSNTKIADLSKALVDKWKEAISALASSQEVASEKEKTPYTLSHDEMLKKRKHSVENDETSFKSSKKLNGHQISLNTVQNSKEKESTLLNVTSDPVRDKCISMFYNALQIGLNEKKLIESNEFDDFENDNAISLAIFIESALFKEFNAVSMQYKAKFRSKYLNLIEKSNPALRQSLINGSLAPEKFIQMTVEEMASEERKKADAVIKQENMLKSRAARDNAAETDMFQCGKCKQRKCKYFQLQTRSADEPMTTYVTCINCGNRWKM